MKKVVLLVCVLSLTFLVVSPTLAKSFNVPILNSIVKFFKRPAPANVTTTHATSTPPVINLNCAVTAVEKREGAIINAYNALTASTTSALTVRKSALLTAWNLTDKQARNTAIKKAWSDFRTAKNAATKVYNKIVKDTWKQFKQDGKGCKTVTAGLEPEGLDIAQ